MISLLATLSELILLVAVGALLLELRRQLRCREAAVAERNQTAALLEESELRFRILARATNEAVRDWNLDTHAVWWNRNLQALFGYNQEEIGLTIAWWRDNVHPDDRDAIWASLQSRGTSNEDFWSGEYRFRRADGTYADIFDRGYIVRDRDGRAVRMIASMMDITRRKRAMELAKSRDAALESARLKSQFLANMSHEIRTPMNSVIGMTDILLHTELTPEQQEFVQIVRMSGESLLTIINDILDFSRIEAGKLQFEMLDFELRDTVEEVVTMLQEETHAKRLRLSSFVSADVPTMVRGDPGRLRQVLTNLVSNAIKFTSQGAVTIRATKDDETECHVVLRFEVTDTGIGIPEEARACLFQPFSQVDASTTRKYGGTGLGLAICKQLVNLMAGEIGCDSVPERGSVFWFTARFEKVSAASLSLDSRKPAAPAPRLTEERRKQTRILVAEDNAFNQKVVLRQLREMGFGVDAVADGAEALEAMNRIPYDLVLMDCQMPEMDGYTCAFEIRRREDDHRHVPIIAMTSHVRKEDRDKCLAVGMNDFLSKPVRVSHLENVLTNWLSDRPSAAPPTAEDPVSVDGQGNGTSCVPVDMEVLAELANHNPPRLRELGDRYIAQTTAQLAKLRDAIAGGVAAEVRDIAHSMAGSSAMCGMTHLVECLRQLEQLGHDGRLAGAQALYTKIETEFERIQRFLSEVNP